MNVPTHGRVLMTRNFLSDHPLKFAGDNFLGAANNSSGRPIYDK
jgi:hypothetical protein